MSDYNTQWQNTNNNTFRKKLMVAIKTMLNKEAE
jgi:hypothetical protein